MRFKKKKNNFFFLMGALFATGCGQPVLGVQVDVVTQACPGVTDTSPIGGVTKLRFSLSGDGLDAQTLTVDLKSGQARLPNIASPLPVTAARLALSPP